MSQEIYNMNKEIFTKWELDQVERLKKKQSTDKGIDIGEAVFLLGMEIKSIRLCLNAHIDEHEGK